MSYIKNNWENGDLISAEKLNHMEDGIEEASQSGGIDDYSDLKNKPSINDVELTGNKTLSQLNIQEELISGTNIKTINNQSILGAGNINISGSGGELSAVTPTDEGKILKVINGSWSVGVDEQGSGGGEGLSDDVKTALLAIFTKVAYTSGDAQDYYDALEEALYPDAPKTLLSITATFNQGSEVIYDTATLESLKTYLVVTANYSDSTTETITDYTLSGTLTVGASTVTVTYEGLTTTFTVEVTHQLGTYSVTNNLTGCATSNTISAITENTSYSATITANNGYSLTGATVSVTMGGTDITSTAYNNGTISIASVTGNLVITITAVVVTLSSISAVYTQAGTVYTTDSLNSLKSNLVVTAYYSDSSSAAVTDYILSGTLAVGTSTITVTYQDKTTTFTVTVTEVVTVTSIDAVYTQTGNVYMTDSLNSLKNDLVVTANYSNGTSATVTDYSLSGSLLNTDNKIEDTSTITVTYEGQTDTFEVNKKFKIIVGKHIWNSNGGGYSTYLNYGYAEAPGKARACINQFGFALEPGNTYNFSIGNIYPTYYLCYGVMNMPAASATSIDNVIIEGTDKTIYSGQSCAILASGWITDANNFSYVADGTYTYMFVTFKKADNTNMTSADITAIQNALTYEVVEPTLYSVTNTLSGCTTSNSATTAAEGSSYSATITVSTGYTLTGATVSVVMGETDITSTAYNNGTISIASVDGDISITVTAESDITPGVWYDLTPSMFTATRSDVTINSGGFIHQENVVTTSPETKYPEIMLDSRITGLDFDIDNTGAYTWLIMAGTKDNYGAIALTQASGGYPAQMIDGQTGKTSGLGGTKLNGCPYGNGHYTITRDSSGITISKTGGASVTYTTANQPIYDYGTSSSWIFGFCIQPSSPTGNGYKNIKVMFGNGVTE